MRTIRRLTALAFSMLAIALPMAPAAAESVEEFYRGKVIKVIVPTGPGGTYGLFGALINEALSRFIPGNPKLVMQFIPSGIQATNFLYNVPAKDGLTIGMLSQSSGLIQVMTPDHVKYDLRQFAALGLFAQLNAVMTVSEKTSVRSVDELKANPITLGAVDTSSYQFLIPTTMNRYLGMKNKIVTGYKGIAESTLAMERGEVDGVFTSWLAIKEQRQRESFKARVLMQVGYQKEPDLDAPLLDSFAPDERAKQAFAFIASFSALSRSLIAPPGLPADRLAALRQATAAVIADPEFAATLVKRNLPFSPLSWQVQQQIMDRTVATSPDLVR